MKKSILLISAALVALDFVSEAGKPSGGGGSVPLCVTFDDLLEDRMGSDGAAYCDAEADVECASVGSFAFYTDKRNGPRKVWLDFTDAISVTHPALIPPRGLYEVQFWLHRLNDAEGNCIGDYQPGGILTMTPGQSLYSGLNMYIYASSGDVWFLNFGGWCGGEAGRSPLLLTGGADLNGDGLSDEWRVETTTKPSGENARAYLNKVVKSKHQSVGVFSVPFGLEFRKQ